MKINKDLSCINLSYYNDGNNSTVNFINHAPFEYFFSTGAIFESFILLLKMANFEEKYINNSIEDVYFEYFKTMDLEKQNEKIVDFEYYRDQKDEI